ncbi:Hypothetical protein NTJ_02664 [Nesidiocoris tenuis]|uniref:Ribosomal RNA-processing protein 14/surfeit locus protein 6 C-terminal domain-containing protein n=1 Tax=Nesidiocoris tenuis TaxID=355587 RepID=A0ABN7AC31_9HEMI|nr:Hypothetical protein NTJ_02664 [Nesidiocoris tenuis]
MELPDPFIIKLKSMKEDALSNRRESEGIRRKRRAACSGAKTDVPKEEVVNKNAATKEKKGGVSKSIASKSTTTRASSTPKIRPFPRKPGPSCSTIDASLLQETCTDQREKMKKVPSKREKESKLQIRAAALERKRKQLERIRSDPVKYAAFKHAEKLRSSKRRAEGKIKKIADLTERQKRIQRKKWQQSQRESKIRKKQAQAASEFVRDSSPVESDPDVPEEVEEPPI